MEPKDGQIQSISASEQPYWKPTVKVHIRCIDGVVKTFLITLDLVDQAKELGQVSFSKTPP